MFVVLCLGAATLLSMLQCSTEEELAHCLLHVLLIRKSLALSKTRATRIPYPERRWRTDDPSASIACTWHIGFRLLCR